MALKRTYEKFGQENGVATLLTDRDYLAILRTAEKGVFNPETGENYLVPIALIGSYYLKVTVSAAELKVCGTSPVVTIPAPGSGFFISSMQAILTRAGGGVDWGFGDNLYLGTEGGDNQYIIDSSLFNAAGALNLDLVKQGYVQAANAAFILSVIGGSDNNSPTGDRDIDIEMFYKIHAIKS